VTREEERADVLGDPAGAAWPAELPRPVDVSPLRGGYVGTTWRATLADGRDVVVKRTPYPADAEADGLAALSAAGVPTPTVLGLADGTLVLERVSGTPDWPGLGRAVAGMHQTRGLRFGWHRDNHAGLFVQPNGWLDTWAEFFVERRVRPHLADAHIPAGLRLRIERACDGPIHDLLPGGSPVLTHGDLWLGNVVDGRWVIDPEVSLADRELDLAYMQMSETNPLPEAFWAAYTEILPIPEDYPRRRAALELHHRLLQVRHFGDSQVPSLARALAACGW